MGVGTRNKVIFGLQLGKPKYVAVYISALFSSASAPTYFLRAAECGHDSAGQVTQGDLVIAISNGVEMKATLSAFKL
jgi:D-arabinose 5-phosphate isomerase GutQ